VGGSMYFNGSTDYLSIASGNLLNLSSSNNWTLEAWIYPVSTLSNYMHIFFGSGISFGTLNNTLIVTDNNVQLISGGTIGLNMWHHIALVNVASTSYNLYLNGVRTNTSGARSFTSTATYIGGNSAGGQLWPGYISQARITNTAVYTGTSYTIPSAPLTAITGTQLLLSGTNAAIYDQTAKNHILTVGSTQLSTSQSKFGTASMYFNGTSDYITMPTTVNLQLGTGDFTIETWSYLTSRASSYPCIFSNYNSFTTGALSIFAGHASSSSTAYQVAYNGSFPAIAGGTITYNTWNHIALVRNSGTLTLYINGTVTGTPVTGATAALNGVGTVTYIGTAGDSPTGGYIAGYLDDYRISKYARYTGAFTPSAVEFGDTGSGSSSGGAGGITGGTKTTSGSYTIHTFTSSGSFVTDSSLTIDYLVVAGGGGGCDTNGGGGGGGAGGMLSANSFSLPSGTYTIQVGDGGVGGVVAGLGTNGANSFISGSGITTITAVGGGRGGDSSGNTAAGGGSGGGGSYGYAGGAGVAGQGNDGGTGALWTGAGGGGKGSAGSNSGSQTFGGNGGSGAASSISGSSVYYAGGGGGGAYSGGSGPGGLGGGTATTAQKGGGGNGGFNARGVNGNVNTGGGGGGGSNYLGGGNGGSGVVFIRYLA
jgi:hypothetical protein